MHALPVLLWTSCLALALGADCPVTSTPSTPSTPPPSSSCEIRPADHEELRGNFSSTRIIGGTEAAAGQFPYQAALFINETGSGSEGLRFCGGSIISSQLVLTAAHCTPDRTQEIAVIVGELNMQSGDLFKKRIMADAFYSHENYTNNGEELINDISLVHLSTSIEYNERVQPIRLPASDIGSLDGDKVVMSGWGRTSTHGDTSPVLRFVESIAIPNKICQLAYLAFGKIRDSNLCVSGWFMKGTCLGDSGGPLAITEDDGKPTLVGIISFVLKYSCNLSFPPVFTRVSSFVPWILTAIEDMKRGRNAKSRAVRLLL